MLDIPFRFQAIENKRVGCLSVFRIKGIGSIFHGKTVSAQQNQQIFHGKMDKGYEKERFESVSIKASVVKKFRRYSRKISKSQSMTLLLMIEFFEDNGISLNEPMGPHMQTLERLIKKRINGVIAILKDIEKSQTKPTVAMMESLFKEAEPKKKPLILEKKNEGEKPPEFRERNQMEL